MLVWQDDAQSTSLPMFFYSRNVYTYVSALSHNELEHQEVSPAAKSGATGARNGDFDPDLQAVITAWPALPKEIQTEIMTLVLRGKIDASIWTWKEEERTTPQSRPLVLRAAMDWHD